MNINHAIGVKLSVGNSTSLGNKLENCTYLQPCDIMSESIKHLINSVYVLPGGDKSEDMTLASSISYVSSQSHHDIKGLIELS